MRFEIALFLIVAGILANIYTDGKFLKKMLSYKKYYQMAGIVFGAFAIYWLIKRNPLRANQIITSTNDYIKYLPIDSGTASILSPILDFTSKHNFSGGGNANFNNSGDIENQILPMSNLYATNSNQTSEARLMQSGKKATKRSVSETKKKFVAARQNWKCGNCDKQLTAWFEVDHKIRLEYGGSNHIDNLVALCRECHGEKTTIENL